MSVSLQNLLGGSIESITPSQQTIRRLLDAAARNIADGKVREVSAETRFAAAHTAIRMLADAGLHAHGFRTLTSKPGHHQTATQTLTLGIDARTVIRLDALRKQRHLTEYTGETIPQATVTECLKQAEALLAVTTNWLKTNRPDLL